MSIDNFESFSAESQKTLCDLITRGKTFFDNGWEVCSEYSDGMQEKLSQAFERAKQCVTGLSQSNSYHPSNSQDISNQDHDDDDDVNDMRLK